MDTDNKYILQWREHVLKAAEALKNRDYETYESEIGEMENAYDEMRKDEALSYSGEDTFGAANAMFESALPKLFVNNKKAVREFINTIKEDKNLTAQFMFYETLKEYKNDFDKNKYLEEAVRMTLERTNYKTIMESNQKLYNVIRKYNIKPSEPLNEEDLSFFRLCETIFRSPKSLTALSKLNEAFNKVSAMLEERARAKAKINEGSSKKTMTVQEFTDKYNKTLTNEEKELVSTILDSSNDDKRKKIYEDFKNSCMERIESILTESNNETKSRLSSLLETVSAKEYNKDTVVKDIIKIMEINEILDD